MIRLLLFLFSYCRLSAVILTFNQDDKEARRESSIIAEGPKRESTNVLFRLVQKHAQRKKDACTVSAG